MKKFACALLGACVYAVDPIVTVQISSADVMKTTGWITDKVEGTGSSQVLNKNISMAVKMLGDTTNEINRTNEDDMAIAYSYTCQISDLATANLNATRSNTSIGLKAIKLCLVLVSRS